MARAKEESFPCDAFRSPDARAADEGCKSLISRRGEQLVAEAGLSLGEALLLFFLLHPPILSFFFLKFVGGASPGGGGSMEFPQPPLDPPLRAAVVGTLLVRAAGDRSRRMLPQSLPGSSASKTSTRKKSECENNVC